MKAGTAQKNITPEPGIDLSGYAARVQPSIGKHDDLYARILFLEHGGQRILWIHCDLIGFDNDLAGRIRQAAAARLALAEKDVFLSATHTHSGPATVFLRNCGKIDDDYTRFLTDAIADGAQEAVGNAEDVRLCFAETQLGGIARDRRRPSGNSHTDTTLPLVGFQRQDGSYKAVITNYAIHNVGFSSGNRLISADIAGFAAQQASAKINGKPLVLLTNGGCGNINPIAKADDYSEITTFGAVLAAGITHAVEQARPGDDESLSSSFMAMALPREVLSPDELESIMAKHREDFLNSSRDYVNTRVFDAYCDWYDETRAIIEKKKCHATPSAFIHVLKIGGAIFAGMNMEVFSSMAAQLRRTSGHDRLYVVGYSDGCIGYLAPRPIYAEGGYEVEGAHKFYGHFRFSPGGFEQIRDQTAKVVESLSPPPARGK